MDYETQMVLQKELDSGERLLWSGKPKQGTLFRSSDFLAIPFSLMWGGFAIFWEYMALRIPAGKGDPAAMLFPLFGVPFVLIGLYLIFGRFIYDAKKRAKTVYGLTNQRALIVSGILRKTVKSLSLRTLSDVSLTQHSNGYGTIVFGQENSAWSPYMGWGFPGAGRSMTPKFELIKDAKQVFAKLREQQASR